MVTAAKSDMLAEHYWTLFEGKRVNLRNVYILITQPLIDLFVILTKMPADSELRQEAEEKFYENNVKNFLERAENILKERGTEYFAGNDIIIVIKNYN